MYFSARILKIDRRLRNQIFASTSEGRSVQTAIRVNNVNAVFSPYDIVIIQITYVQCLGLVVKVRTIILTSVIKAQIVHKMPSFIH